MNQKVMIPVDNVNQSIETLQTSIVDYVEILNLPSTNVVSPVIDRAKVIQNFPNIVSILPEEYRKDCKYLTKFIISISAGLFDAALNYLWDILIKKLRESVLQFDVDYFYDSIIPASRKNEFSTPDDLMKLRDSELLKGCMDVGFIDQSTFMRLNFIREVRNYSSSAHPSDDEIKPYELLGLLETIVERVLLIPKIAPIVQINILLQNIRKELISDENIAVINENLQKLEQNHCNNLLKALFGHYSDPRLPTHVKINIQKIVKNCWDQSSLTTKNEIGIQSGQYAVLGNNDRAKLSRKFLDIVDGLAFLSDDQKAIDMRNIIEDLKIAHNGWDNFFNEVPHAKRLYQYIKESAKIPKNIRNIYVEILIICAIGNSFNVSKEAYPYYINMIKRFEENEIIQFFNLISENNFILNFPHTQKQFTLFKNIAEIIKANAISQKWKSLLNLISTESNWKSISIKLNKEWKKH